MNTLIPVKPNSNEHDPNSLTVTQAKARIMDTIQTVSATERMAIRHSLGRVLAADIISPINNPPYDNSAMDGYAIRATDIPQQNTASLSIIGTSWAGKPFTGTVHEGQCIRIMTGAKMPDGADTVIMQEHVRITDNSININCGHHKAQNVRYIGDDLKAGDRVIKLGKLIGPAEIGVFASLGIAEVTVFRKCRVAFFSTGDELRAVGEVLQDGQIYDSNRYTLYGMLCKPYIEMIDMGVIADVVEDIESAFHRATEIADVVITSGGVSVGDADYVKETLEKLGNINFWKIAMKPGRPLAFGKIHQAVFFGLPGNPVSVMATFSQFALPALRRISGQAEFNMLSFQVPCATALNKRAGRVDFQRGILQLDDTGQLSVSVSGLQSSHILSAMSHANCFIILSADTTNIAEGSMVEVQPFNNWMN